jgi:hypothetical protein
LHEDEKNYMATEILNPKVEYTGLFDLVGVGVVKQLEESLTAPIIGNGTFISGGIKLVGGSLLHGKGGRLGNIASSALLVDAGEDIALALMGMLSGKTAIGGGNTSKDEFGG